MYLKALTNYFLIRKNQWLSPTQVQELQWKRFKQIIEHAYENVPFYRNKFDAAGVHPDDIKTRKDITKIPITTKEELIATQHSTLAKGYTPHNCYRSQTSGSTGQPFVSYFDTHAWATLKFAVKLRARRACGMGLGKRLVNIEACTPQEARAANTSLASYLTALLVHKKLLSVFDDIKNHIPFYKQFKPHILYGFGSYFLTLAEYLKKNNETIRPRMIFTSAEMLDANTKNNLQNSFQCDVFDIYGSTELKEVSWECPHKKGYHINDDVCLVEFVHKGKHVRTGDEGEIVATSLVNKAMPLIRYSVGDRGQAIRKKCTCGRGFSLMKPSLGRSVDYFIAGNKHIAPYTLTTAMEGVPGVIQYQIIQKTKSKVQILVRTTQAFNTAVKQIIVRNFQKILGKHITITIKKVSSISREKNGKYRVVKSEVYA